MCTVLAVVKGEAMGFDTSTKNAVTLSYGALAGALAATLVVGVLSGAAVGLVAAPFLSGENARTTVASRGWIGITYVPITERVARSQDLPVTNGALILAVAPDSPAAKAGIEEQDIVTAVNQQAIDATISLMNLVAAQKPGDRVEMTVIRDGSERKLTVTLGQLPGSQSKRTTPLDRLRRSLDDWRGR